MTALPSIVTDSYYKRFAAMVAVVLIVVAGVGVFFQGTIASEIRQDEQAELRTVAELEADALGEWIARNGENARLISKFREVETEDPSRVGTTLDSELERLPDSTHSIHYIDIGSDRIIESTSDSRVGGSVGTLRWSRGSLDDSYHRDPSAVAISEVYRRDDLELVAFVSRIDGTDRAIMLTVNAGQRADQFQTPTESSFTQVVDADGVVALGQREGSTLEPYMHGDGHVRSARQGETGVTDMPERSMVAGYAPVEGSEWVVITHASRSEAYTLAGVVSRDIVALVGVALAGFLLIGATLGRNTVNALDRLTRDAEAIARGDLDAELAATERDDEIGRLVDAFADMQSYLSTAAGQAEAVADGRFDAAVLDADVPGTFGETIGRMNEDVERAQREAEQARRDVEDLNAALEAQADSFGETMSRAAAGDLTQRMDADGRSEAMTEIAESFNGMMDDMETTVSRIRTFADEVATASQRVTTSTEEVENASADVTESVQEISAGTERQNERLTTVSGEMQTLSGAIEEVASSADEVTAAAERAAETSDAGNDAATDALDELERIESRTEETAARVSSLAEEVDEIGEVVDLIADIADRTNVLALNASVEAAHADDDGDGFAVVADEIKRLAGEATDATERIDGHITEVQEAANDAVDDMRTTREHVANGGETIDDALASLSDIARQVDELHTGVREISEATDDQAASTEDVVAMLDEVSDVADRSNAEAANVSAAAEEQTSTLSDVSENARSLSKRAESLRELLDGFTVGDDRGATALDGVRSATADGGRTR